MATWPQSSVSPSPPKALVPDHQAKPIQHLIGSSVSGVGLAPFPERGIGDSRGG